MSEAFVRVVRAGPDLPPKGPEPYVRINTFTLDDLGLTESDLSPALRLQVGSSLLHVRWELYTAEPDAGPILRLRPRGLRLTGLRAGRTYVARYEPSVNAIHLIRPVAGK